MIKKLQYRNLEWNDEIAEEDIIKYTNGSMDYILEVDVEYPKELHDLQNALKFNYPLAPEVKNVKANMLSDKQVEIHKQINGSEEPADEKTKKDIERK